MSRSSKGFADFFPTAPSVLQQKKSRSAQEKKRQSSTSSTPLPSTLVHTSPERSSATAKKGDRRTGAHSTGVSRDQSVSDTFQTGQDESESVQGDLLNGVGSASSSSTVSSVFDAQARQHDASQQKPNHQSELTPLTATDSSSPGTHKSPVPIKPESSSTLRPDFVPQAAKSAIPPASNGMVMATAFSGGDGVRPGSGQIKGVKATYDPELDKTISSKERRNRRPVYKDIKSDVRSPLSKANVGN